MRQIDNMTPAELDTLKLKGMLTNGRAALDGDSNDAEHDALFDLVTLLERTGGANDWTETVKLMCEEGDPRHDFTGGANDHYEEQQREASHFVPADGETDAERNQ